MVHIASTPLVDEKQDDARSSDNGLHLPLFAHTVSYFVAIHRTRQLVGSRTYTVFVKIKETSSLRYCAHCTACRQFLIMHRVSCIMSWLLLAITTTGNYRLGVRRALSTSPMALQASKFARPSRIWPAECSESTVKVFIRTVSRMENFRASWRKNAAYLHRSE